MKRTISSLFHSAVKVLTLILTVLGAPLFVIILFSPGPVFWGALALSVGWLAFVFVVFSYKTVKMDDRFLYVSVFRKVVPIPLDEISSVTESIGLRGGRSVTVEFRGETPFGRSISFMPTLVFSLDPFYRDPHPIVAELMAHASLDGITPSR